jgi:hypothetical protein
MMSKLATTLLLVLALPATLLAQRQHAITGRVTSDSGVSISAADVIVTIAPSAETVLGKTDTDGRYRIVIANPTGEYILNVSALGFRAFRQRVTIVAPDTAATVNPRLAASVHQVAAVRVQAQRARPQRGFGTDAVGQPTADGTNKVVDGVTNALSPELQGNIDAMASLIPGLSVTAGGFSAFGLGADANMKTLNGMSFGADAVPRDLTTSTRFQSSPWDPTRGGFSGALAATTISRGSNISARRGRMTLDAPPLQTADLIARRFGQEYTNLQLGGGGSGAIVLDKYFYNHGYQASMNRAPVSSLLDLDDQSLARSGISRDSAFRLTQILAAQGIPLTVSGIPDQRTTFAGSYYGRFDRALPNPPPGSKPLPQWNVTGGVNYSETRGSSLMPTALPATTGKTSRGGLQLQGLYSRYLGTYGDYVNETSAGVSIDENKGVPYLALPSGNVLIASTLADAATATGSLGFGGNAAFARNTRTIAFEANNQTTFLIKAKQNMPAVVYFQSRYEHYDQSLAANRLGSFNFASLEDLANRVPSSFSRTLNMPDRSGGQWLGAAALGSSWSHRRLALTGGLRLDASAYTGGPTINPALERTLGVRNDATPASIALSPRLGFYWYYKAGGGAGMSINNSTYSSIIRAGPQIRGGFGEFRNNLRADLLADAIGSTGLPGSTQRLVCTGPAAPIPNWSDYMSDAGRVPNTCAGGASVFADTAPNVVLVNDGYRPMMSRRATLGWTNNILGMYFTIDGTYSWNRNQPGVVDANFVGTPRFSLATEGNRPVYVDATSIVPATGGVTAVESRRVAAFGRVSSRVSDLRGDTRQITSYLVPSLPFKFGVYTLGYTYSDSRAQARGFDQSAAMDPRAIDWASNPFTPRHQFQLQGGRSFLSNRIALTMFTRVMSGMRFTPTVAGDVNGDGWFGDRAFVFDPARTADTAVRRGLNELLANGSSSARACLTRQLNDLAGRNSCVGPWSASMNASIIIPRVPGANRLSASLNLANPLGGLDQLLHGSSNLRGWGATPFVDGTLYQVRGFDPSTRRYTYQVNSRFGATSTATNTFRSPFRITLDFRMDLGHNRDEQAVILNMRIKPPLVGTRASADTIKNRYMSTQSSNAFSDIYRVMLRYADSLALSRQQTEQLQGRQKMLIARADSLFGTMATYLASLPKDFSAKDAAKRVTDAQTDMWKIIYAEAPFLKEVLTPGQIRLLPGGIRDMILIPGYTGRFFYSF